MEEKTHYSQVVLVSIAFLFCCTISIPTQAESLEPLRSFLASLPLVSATDAVGAATLTQVRYSFLTVFLVLAAGTLTLNLLLSHRIGWRLGGTPPLVSLLLFAAVAAISAVYFKNIADTAKLFVYVELAISIAWMTAGEKRFLCRSLLKLLLTVGVLNALVTVAQFLVLAQGSTGVRALRMARPDGLFGDSILSALVGAMTLFVVLNRADMPWSRKIALSLLLLVAGVLTGARSFYYLAAGACILGVAFALQGSGIKAILCCAICVIGIAAIVVMVDRISDFEESVSSVSSDVLSGRDLKAALALQEFDEHPVIGIGTGRYAHAEAAYYAETMTKAGLNGTNPHNIYLQVLCENGIVGFILFAIFIGCTLWQLWRQRSWQAFSIFGLFLVSGMTLGVFYSASVASFVLALIFANLPATVSSVSER